MPIQAMPSLYPSLSFDETNPVLRGAKEGIGISNSVSDLLTKALQQQKDATLLPYVQPMAEQDLQKAKLYNQYYGPDIQSQIGLRGAQAGQANEETAKIKYLLNNPGYLGGDASKTLQYMINMGMLKASDLTQSSATAQQPVQQPAQQVAQQPGQAQNAPQQTVAPSAAPIIPPVNPAAPFNTPNALANAILNKGYGSAGYQQRMTQAFNWVHSTVDQKNYEVAQLAGAGIDPSEAVSLLSSGLSVPEVLKQKGFDPNNAPEPDFLPTRGNVQVLKQRQSALKSVDSLSQFVTEGLGPYSQTVMNYSPSQISSAISGMDDDKQARFVAARALVPELNMMRLGAAGARIGKYSLSSMTDKSMNNIAALQPLVKPAVWMKAQKIIDERLDKALSASEESYKVAKPQSANTSNKDINSVSTEELMKMYNGGK